MPDDRVEFDIYRETNTIRMRTPYQPEFVEELKALIPYHDRDPRRNPDHGWDGDAKEWGFPSSYLDDVIGLCERYFPRLTPDLNEAD